MAAFLVAAVYHLLLDALRAVHVGVELGDDRFSRRVTPSSAARRLAARRRSSVSPLVTRMDP